MCLCVSVCVRVCVCDNVAVMACFLLVGISVGRSTTEDLFSAGLRGFRATGRTGLKVDSSVEICTHTHTHAHRYKLPRPNPA